MGKSNLGVLTDGINVVTQPESAGKIPRDRDTYSQPNSVLFTQGCPIFIISSSSSCKLLNKK